ncbi:MAG: hypothetical protein R3321_00095, partial [Nitrososphaeraceae archaeon]|nr:hypothetical protein [Nitrososphaeraceae archaeon]
FMYAQSLSFSIHKLYGLPMPASVILCKEPYRKVGGELIEYVSSHDSTICGSRVGLAPLMADYRLSEYNWHEICRKMRDYSRNIYEIIQYRKLSDYLNLYPNSNCIVFDKPSDNLIKKYSLSCQKGKAHIWVMPHVLTSGVLSQFLEDLISEKSLQVA